MCAVVTVELSDIDLFIYFFQMMQLFIGVCVCVCVCAREREREKNVRSKLFGTEIIDASAEGKSMSGIICRRGELTSHEIHFGTL